MAFGVPKRNRKAKPEPQSWYQDRYQHVLVQRKVLAFATLLCLAAAVVLSFTVMELIPLKSIEPYVIQIDSRTGRTEAIDPLAARQLTTNEVVNNYFIVQYLRAREGYAAPDLVYNYNLVRLMSDAGRVYGAFMHVASPNNPESNIARLGTNGVRTIKIRGITYINPQTAQIRLIITEKTDNMQKDFYKIALIVFDYATMNLSPDDRYLNPLGFHVTDYQISDDIQP